MRSRSFFAQLVCKLLRLLLERHGERHRIAADPAQEDILAHLRGIGLVFHRHALPQDLERRGIQRRAAVKPGNDLAEQHLIDVARTIQILMEQFVIRYGRDLTDHKPGDAAGFEFRKSNHCSFLPKPCSQPKSSKRYTAAITRLGAVSRSR